MLVKKPYQILLILLYFKVAYSMPLDRANVSSTSKISSYAAFQSPREFMKSKVNLIILPLSASLIFIGLIVGRCYCWMVEDIREHDRNLDGVFSDPSLRDQHQAELERISSVRLARRLKRGYSAEDPVAYDSMSDSNSDSQVSNEGKDPRWTGIKRSSTTVKTWLDQVPQQGVRSCTSQSSFFTHTTGGSLFLSPRMPLRTRSFTGLHRIPEDDILGHSDSYLPQIENTDSTTLTMASSNSSSPSPDEDLQTLEQARDI